MTDILTTWAEVVFSAKNDFYSGYQMVEVINNSHSQNYSEPNLYVQYCLLV